MPDLKNYQWLLLPFSLAALALYLLYNRIIVLPYITQSLSDMGLIETAQSKAIQIIQASEGLSSKTAGVDKAYNFPSLLSDSASVYAYPDSTGIQTIGWGTIQYQNGNKVQSGDCITKALADDEFNYEFQQKFNSIQQNAQVTLTPGQLAALTSFAYNEGLSALYSSTLWALVNQSDFTNAANEFDKWIYAGGQKINGLVNRRADEKALFLS